MNIVVDDRYCTVSLHFFPSFHTDVVGRDERGDNRRVSFLMARYPSLKCFVLEQRGAVCTADTRVDWLTVSVTVE